MGSDSGICDSGKYQGTVCQGDAGCGNYLFTHHRNNGDEQDGPDSGEQAFDFHYCNGSGMDCPDTAQKARRTHRQLVHNRMAESHCRFYNRRPGGIYYRFHHPYDFIYNACLINIWRK